MSMKTVEAAVIQATKLLKNVSEPWKSLAFPALFEQILLRGGSEIEAESPKKKHSPGPRQSSKKPTRSSMLRQLIQEGWFKKTERSFADIRKELKNRALPTKSTTLPALVLPLVLQGKLKRKSARQGKKEIYVYYN